jgi:hypothetical protein
MGHGRARDGTLGLLAVKLVPWLALVIPVAIPLAGCNSIGAIGGTAVGLAAGAGTTNPLVGYAAGVGTKAAIDELVKYISRKRQQGEQDEIAIVVGRLAPGETAPWRIDHDIPIGNEHGDVTVTDVLDSALARCKEVAFTVIDGDAPNSPRGTYLTTACAQGDTWKWAQAEPATERWGFLQ